ncbi:DUF2809 domain-containing protein [Fictibacillus fluitans]|uniref:DUF2809 domain-containing protein n=1 Tax=Fictibacillus fluitans TaxID=3058422 RepID=A0ABT8HUB4_9BACL|nr:DUF2809 domain-containing protein [Fictibacillus sp. NE201]MDN4524075.1 DUF2809 domain-containing protein [Fictibacillus sp. NE201]
MVMTIMLGLASRAYGSSLPAIIAENAGDALWAAMVYFGFRFLLVRKSLLTAMMLSILFSFAIEFSQLYQADGINQIRDTVVGALILGKGFLPVDLVRYTSGILAAAFLDRCFLHSKSRRR